MVTEPIQKPADAPGRKFARDSLGLVVTQYAVRAMSMGRSFVAAKLLDPLSFGAWNALQLMMDYGALAPLGTQQGLDQMVPQRIVEGDAQRTMQLKRAALFNVVALSVLFAALGLGWASVGSSRMREMWALPGLALALLCVFLVNVSNVGTSILRSYGDISAFTTWFILQGLVGSGLGLVLMIWFGRWGLLWGWLAGCLVAFGVLAFRGRAVLPRMPTPAVESLDLLQVGLPLYLFSASSIVMRNLDRIIVLRFLGTQQLGYYGLSVNVLTLLMAIPDSFVYVSYPILVRRFTEANGDTSAIRDRVERLVRGVSVGLPLAAGLCALGARDLVHAILPRYDACIGPLRVLAFGAVGLSLSAFASIVLMTVGRRVILVPSALFLTAMSGGLQILSLRLNGGLVGIATACASAYLLSGAVLLSFAGVGLGYAFPQLVALILRCLVPTVLAVLLAMGAGWAFLREMGPFTLVTVLRLLAAWAAFAAAYLLCVAPFVRGIGFRALATEFRVPFLGRRPPPPGSIP